MKRSYLICLHGLLKCKWRRKFEFQEKGFLKSPCVVLVTDVSSLAICFPNQIAIIKQF